jgi:hypothetical protein
MNYFSVTSGLSTDDTVNRFFSSACWQSISVLRNQVSSFLEQSIPIAVSGTLAPLQRTLSAVFSIGTQVRHFALSNQRMSSVL